MSDTEQDDEDVIYDDVAHTTIDLSGTDTTRGREQEPDDPSLPPPAGVHLFMDVDHAFEWCTDPDHTDEWKAGDVGRAMNDCYFYLPWTVVESIPIKGRDYHPNIIYPLSHTSKFADREDCWFRRFNELSCYTLIVKPTHKFLSRILSNIGDWVARIHVCVDTCAVATIKFFHELDNDNEQPEQFVVMDIYEAVKKGTNHDKAYESMSKPQSMVAIKANYHLLWWDGLASGFGLLMDSEWSMYASKQRSGHGLWKLWLFGGPTETCQQFVRHAQAKIDATTTGTQFKQRYGQIWHTGPEEMYTFDKELELTKVPSPHRIRRWKHLTSVFIDMCLAFRHLDLPPYVLLEIIDWLPWFDRHRHYIKIQKIIAIRESMRRVTNARIPVIE